MSFTQKNLSDVKNHKNRKYVWLFICIFILFLFTGMYISICLFVYLFIWSAYVCACKPREIKM